MQTLRILSLESKLYGQFSYIPNSPSGVISFFFFFSWGTFRKLVQRWSFLFYAFLELGRELQRPVDLRPGVGRSVEWLWREVVRLASAVLSFPWYCMASRGLLPVSQKCTGQSKSWPDALACTAGCLGPLGIQSHHTRQLRTAVNILTLGSGTEREETRGALRDNQCLSSLIFTNMKTLRFAYISPIAFAC